MFADCFFYFKTFTAPRNRPSRATGWTSPPRRQHRQNPRNLARMRMRKWTKLNHPRHPHSWFLEWSRGAARSRFWLGLRLSLSLLFACFIFGAGRRAFEMNDVYTLAIFYQYKKNRVFFPVDDYSIGVRVTVEAECHMLIFYYVLRLTNYAM